MMALFRVGPMWIVVSMALGALVALLVPVTLEGIRDEYDRSHPVWVAERVRLVKRDGFVTTLDIVGSKVRPCELVRVWAQTTYDDRPSSDAFVQRVPNRPLGYTHRPVGQQDLGEFAVSPVPEDATGLIIYVQHDCSGRPVRSVLGALSLKE